MSVSQNLLVCSGTISKGQFFKRRGGQAGLQWPAILRAILTLLHTPFLLIFFKQIFKNNTHRGRLVGWTHEDSVQNQSNSREFPSVPLWPRTLSPKSTPRCCFLSTCDDSGSGTPAQLALLSPHCQRPGGPLHSETGQVPQSQHVLLSHHPPLSGLLLLCSCVKLLRESYPCVQA